MLNLSLVLQKILTRGLRAMGYSLQKLPPPGYVPINVLDLVIQEAYREKGEFRFIDIGANDGVEGDPLYAYVKNPGWKGLLVEPNPNIFKKLEASYRSIEGMTLENAAIAATDGSVKLYAFDTDDTKAGLLASLHEGYLKYNGDGVRGEIREFEVPALSVATLLRKHRIDSFDLLQIDTEGSDYPILMQFLDSGILPRIIHFENNFMTTKERDRIGSRFAELGYRYLHIGIDTLAYRQANRDASFEGRMAASKLS